MQESKNEQRVAQQAQAATVLAAETLRNSAAAGESVPLSKGEEPMSLFWRICGGTLLSITALVAITLYQQVTGQLNELRNELAHLNSDFRKDLVRLNENHAELVKKDEFSSRVRSVWDSINQLQQDKTAVGALKEHCALMEQQFKTAEDDRRELARQVQQLREAKASEEERKRLAQELQELRERLAALAGQKMTALPASRGREEARPGSRESE